MRRAFRFQTAALECVRVAGGRKVKIVFGALYCVVRCKRYHALSLVLRSGVPVVNRRYVSGGGRFADVRPGTWVFRFPTHRGSIIYYLLSIIYYPLAIASLFPSPNAQQN